LLVPNRMSKAKTTKYDTHDPSPALKELPTENQTRRVFWIVSLVKLY